MSRTQSKATVNNFVGGLVSDFHELNNPPNTTVDEDNCDLDRRGSRRRRLGIDFEADYDATATALDATDWDVAYTKALEWRSVNNDGNLNFEVIQSGETLSFFDLNSVPLSAGEKSFTVSLETFRAPAYYTTAIYGVQVASGKGTLFVVGEAINPFYIQYDPVTDTITTTQLNLKVRDLELQDHTLSYIDQVATLTAAQQYDLYNQGWNYTTNVAQEGHGYHTANVLADYRTQKGKYPPKSKSWWVGKTTNITFGVDEFVPTQYDTVYVGNQLAPLGTYILSVFSKDRTGASGISGLPVQTESSRPTAVAFGAGRVFYGFKNKFLFSQVIEDDFSVAERCYQAADPTAEKISDLVATDGGIQQIIDASTIISMVSYENQIFAFASNGIWAIGGSSIGSGFSATDYSVYKVSEAGPISSRSIVSLEGQPFWWSKLGVYQLAGDPAKQGYSVQNILEKKLQIFYNAIPPLSKLRATGAYDRTKKVLTWLYNSTDNVIGGNPYVGDTLLHFDTILGAFYKWSITQVIGNSSPYVVDLFNVPDIVVTVTTENVVNNSGAVVTNIATDDVTIDVSSFGNSTNTQSSLKFLTYYQG